MSGDFKRRLSADRSSVVHRPTVFEAARFKNAAPKGLLFDSFEIDRHVNIVAYEGYISLHPEIGTLDRRCCSEADLINVRAGRILRCPIERRLEDQMLRYPEQGEIALD